MKTYLNPPPEEWKTLLARPLQGENDAITEQVSQIVEQVRQQGDTALRILTQRFDGAQLEELAVTVEEFERAEQFVDSSLKEAIKQARQNITAFHRAQRMEPISVEIMPGVVCQQRSVPIPRVGLYVPGGSAPLFSTVLMLAIPAMLAGCREVILCTPAGKNGTVAPEILWTARLCGITRVFKLGGAQAIAAMAYGTESVPKIDKIFGPGNRYVTTAKQLLGLNAVAIDMPAGPSEVMVLADATARAEFVAADLLSQSEHGADSQALLVTTSEKLAREVALEIERQLATLSRSETARKSLEESRILILSDEEQLIACANAYAAEHLIIETVDPERIAERIENAGSIFLGHYTPESIGDYASGTNHTLPTGGWARSFSGVNLDSFCKKITLQRLTTEGLKVLGPTVEAMASSEGLDGHQNAVSVRLNSLK